MILDEERLLNEKYGGKDAVGYEQDKKRLALGEPLAYVIGWQPFLGLKIYLDSKPLIPRPETEWWTEQLLQNAQAHRLKNVSDGDGASSELAEGKLVVRLGLAARSATNFAFGGELRFLDLCAGSGAIGCAALAKLPNAHVFFSEIDPAHKATILKNIRENKLDESRAFVQIGNLFEPFDDMKFDIIAANPPYVPSGRRLPTSVADYEPALALFAGADGLDYMRRIAEELPRRLNKGGMAWIECDIAAAAAAAALFEKQGFNAVIRTDQYDKSRIIVVSFP